MGYVSKVFIEKEIKSLQRKKAAGIDNLSPGLLKDCTKYISRPLCYIINLSIKTSTVPLIWKNAKVISVFKSGDPAEPGNYRPISILPTLSKILEKAVHNSLMDFLEMENLLTSQQYGFRQKRSTKMAATLLPIKFAKKLTQEN